MNRRTTITIAVALLVALAAIPLGMGGVLASDHGQADEDDTESVAPGERLSGVVGVQDAELQGELSDRTYGIKLANAESPEERADVVDEQFDDVEDRLADLEQRLDDLEDAREDGEISEGQYRAEVATIAAEKATAERTAESAQATAGELPDEVLEDREIDLESIDELRERADELGGEAVAEIAQSIAGDAVGQSLAPDREPGATIDAPGPDRADGPADDEDDSDAESPDDGTDESENRTDR